MRKSRGERQKFSVPMQHLIGKFNIRIYGMTQIISELRNELYNIQVLVGREQHPQTIQIESYIGIIDKFEVALTQDIITEETIADVEKRLAQIIDRANGVNLTVINEKLKVLSDSLKLRYGGSSEQPEAGHLEEGGGMRTGARPDICDPSEDRPTDNP